MPDGTDDNCEREMSHLEVVGAQNTTRDVLLVALSNPKPIAVLALHDRHDDGGNGGGGACELKLVPAPDDLIPS